MIPRVALPIVFRPASAALLAASVSLLAASTSLAMDISGIVLTKAELPVPLAQVCLKNNPSKCAATTINGTFRIVDASSVRAPGAAAGYGMEIRGDRLALSAPSAGRVKVEWLDPMGRALAPAREAELAAGRNLFALPILPRDGMHILRVTAPDRTLAWKVLLLGGGASSARREGGHTLFALSKRAAAISELLVSKTGFRSELYLPSAEVENDAVIFLTALSDSGFVYTSTFKAKNTIDKAKKTIITEATFDTCKADQPDPVTVKDTLNYAVRDGKLYQFYEGQCRAEVATGTSTEAVGTWTPTQSDVFLPADLRPASCQDNVPASSVPTTVKPLLTIGETEQSFQISAEVCPPDLYLTLIGMYLLSDTTIELTKNTCRALTFKNGKGEEATMNFSRRGTDSLATSFAYKTAACNGVENMKQGEGVKLDCSGADPVLDLLECIAGTGYFGPVGVPGPGPVVMKRSILALPSLAASLRPRLPAAVPARKAWSSLLARPVHVGRF